MSAICELSSAMHVLAQALISTNVQVKIQDNQITNTTTGINVQTEEEQ